MIFSLLPTIENTRRRLALNTALSAVELKARLQGLAQTGRALPEQDELEPLLAAMLEHIGSVDPVLRDGLIYPTFAAWVSKGDFGDSRLRALLDAALDEQHLFYGIGEQGTDSVFTRTFSMLLVALLIYQHRSRPFLEAAELLKAAQAVIGYTRLEQDRRGYVPGKGWAHAAAHASDTLDEFARCDELGEETLREILASIQSLILTARMPYGYEEDERLSVATVAVLERGLVADEVWQAWLEGFPAGVAAGRDLVEQITLRVNARGLLRSFFFRIRRPEVIERIGQQRSDRLAGLAEAALTSIARF
jgi:hypothetical protein